MGGGTEGLSLVVALLAIGFGWVHRAEVGVTMLVGFLPSGAMILLTLSPAA